MSTIFTINPIKINIISTKNVIKQTIVFIGNVPKEIKHDLMKIESSGNYNAKNKNLIKFYGKNWYIRLGLKKSLMSDRKTGGKSVDILGGDDFSFDDDDTSEVQNTSMETIEQDDLIEDNPTEDDPTEESLKQLKEGNEPADIKIVKKNLEKTMKEDQNNKTDFTSKEPIKDENTILLEDLDELDESATLVLDEPSISKISQITETEGKLKVKFIFTDPYVSIYPEDKILEFKRKIYTIINIPIFRQHIWYVYQGRTYPLNYSVFENDSLLYINVQDMLSKYNNVLNPPQLIEGIPVNTVYYQKKAFLKIVSLDTFSILEEFYNNYGITEYNLLDLDDFIAPARKSLTESINDTYQLELIYYSFIILYWPMLSLAAFTEYIKAPNNIQKFYPELQQTVQEVNQIYKLEKKIIDEKNDLITNPKKRDILKKIRGTITNSITESIISVLKYQNNKDMILFIRNLFDKFELNESVIGCKCYINHDGKKIILNKSYKGNSYIKDILTINTIMFRIKVNKETTKTVNLTLYINGNYIIKSTWREEDQYDFDDIFRICHNLTKPIIDKINSIGPYVLANKKTIPTMNKNNSKFTEIGMSMFYKKSLTQPQFNILRDLMNDYRKAGIVRDRLSEKSVSEYYFSKGMYQFKANRIERVINVSNYYDFLTDGVMKQKWFTIFEKTRITRMFHRFSDIKIEIVGIKEKEFFIFYNFILTLFYLFDKKCSTSDTCKKENIQLTTERKLKKTLRNLKEQDPILYNFKKIYKTENVYSKICQKPYQPLLLNKQGYDSLPKEKKDKAVKYWNFTTNKDAYYSCPNPKFPYIKFIVKRHPKDYCIPCCKKTEVAQSSKDAKKIIYDICLKTHKYEKAERTITLGSRYIMTYGKEVEPGRLSRLPENSLEPLFYETYSIQAHGIDPECVTTDGYFLYGIDQCIKGIKNVGVLNILLNATETDIIAFINNLISLMKSSENKFRILLDGNINKYFKNLNDFITTLRQLFLMDNPINSIDDQVIPWNKLFINIAYMFLNINIIYFQHKKQDAVRLLLPSYITNKDQFFSNDFTNLIILQKRNVFYPIYLLNTDMFFKVKMFKQKLFNFNDPITLIIGKLVSAYFNNKIKNNITDDISLIVVQSFVRDTSYQIQKLFINSSNMCYYIHLTNKNKNIYVPIELSYHLSDDKIKICYEMYFRNKSKMDINTMMTFMKDFNHWIAQKSEKEGMIYDKDVVDKNRPLEERVQPIYPYIKISKWIVLATISQKIHSGLNVIGFVSNNINYYISNIKLGHAIKIKKAPVMQMFYDPDIINKSIYIKENIVSDHRSKMIGRSIYKSNLYHLLLLEFMTVFNNQKNTKLRQKIKHKLLGNLNKDFDLLMEEVSKLVTDCDDYYKIKTQVCEFINNHHSKNLLFKEIDDTFYKFDRAMFETIKKLPRDKLHKELEKISRRFIIYGDVSNIKDLDFPNMFISCQEKQTSKYCKNNKLIVDKKRLGKMLDIMTADILNPVKEKWLFSDVFSNNVINFFKFTKRQSEHITIEIID
jgi:hypothetical protein